MLSASTLQTNKVESLKTLLQLLHWKIIVGGWTWQISIVDAYRVNNHVAASHQGAHTICITRGWREGKSSCKTEDCFNFFHSTLRIVNWRA